MAKKSALSVSDKNANRRPVVVFTEHRGVFFGYVEGPTEGKTELVLHDAKMLIKFQNGKGVFQVTSEGPVGNCHVSAPCPRFEVNKISGVADVTPEAALVWAAK